MTPVSHVYMLRSVEQAGTACRAPTLRFARFSVLPWAARVATAVLLLAGLWSFVSCSGDGPEGEGPEAYEIQQAYEDDAVSLTLKVSRREITAADRVELVLEALTPEEQQIEFPSFDEKLGEFAVVDSRTSAPRLVEGGRVLTAKSGQPSRDHGGRPRRAGPRSPHPRGAADRVPIVSSWSRSCRGSTPFRC